MKFPAAFPQSLWCLVYATLAFSVQQPVSLSLNALYSFSGANLSGNAPIFSLPQAQQLVVSIAICSNETTSPAFFVTNNSYNTAPAQSTSSDVFEIPLQSGFGNWTGTAPQGGFLTVQNVAQTFFQVAVSNGCMYPEEIYSVFHTQALTLSVALVHQLLPSLPLLGDTTNTQALIFSPPFSFVESSPSTYPNYTLPPANLSAPSPPSSPPTFSLFISPASSGLASGPQTACSVQSASTTVSVLNNDFWMRGDGAWRSQWLVDGLTPSTNYTAYVVQDQVNLSGPIYFTTKSRAFPPLLHQCILLYLVISILLLSPRAFPSILPIHGLRRPSSLPPIPCDILQLYHSTTRHIRPSSSVHVQLHCNASYIFMWT